MPIIIVHVVFNSKTVFEWEGFPVNKDMDIKEFFKDVVVYKLRPELVHIAFDPTAQFVRNVGTVIECCECNKWRVLYSKSKLSPFELSILERYLDTIQYTCGDSFEALAKEMENVGQNESNINDDENNEN